MRSTCVVVSIIVALLASLVVVCRAAETVGEMTYTYIGPSDFDFGSVAANALISLNGAGFASEHPPYSKTAIGASNVLEIISNGDYGGVLIWVSHGGIVEATGQGWVEVETFPYTSQGASDAYDRKTSLVSNSWFTNDELAVTYSTESWGTYHYALALVGSGISSNFAGANGIAVIAACNSNATGGYWGARTMVGYASATTNTEAESDLATLFGNLTAHGTGDHSKMTVGLALDQTSMTIGSGTGETALYPWVTYVDPNPGFLWVGGQTMVNVYFGVDMAQTPAQPFYVGGVGVIRNTNEWVSATRARVNVYSGWATGSILVGSNSPFVLSSRGVPLLGGDDYYLTYTSAVNTFPPAASVNAFVPVLESGGVDIHVDLASLRGSTVLWVERNRAIVDSVRVDRLSGHTFDVLDPAGRASDVYRLMERERDGDVFVRATEGVVRTRPHVVNQDATIDKEDLATLADDLRARYSVDLTATGPFDGIIICPDSFATNAQILADYWTSKAQPVKVIPLSQTGTSRGSIKARIAQEYESGTRYVLLAGTASDYEWFDDPSKWPDMPGEDDWYFWWEDYHTLGGYYYYESQPERNLIPTWYFEDSEYDNMSYWTPYYSGDWPYREGLPGLRIGRFPVSNNQELLNMISKDIYYSEHSSSWAWTSNVSLWGQCHNWDGNSGETIQILLGDLSSQIPDTFTQYALYDTTWSAAERESLAVADWDEGRGIIHMRGTSSTFYKPLHFFSKANGWYIGRLAPSQKYPLVVGTCCGIGTYDMAEDPTYGRHFAVEILAGDPQRGAIGVIGPSRGTETEGNRQMGEALNRYLSVEPVANIGTAFYDAQTEVMESGDRKVAGSFNLLGDPMTPVPGGVIASSVAEDPQPRTILLQNCPNPFNPATTLKYYLAKRAHVRIRVYDVAGRLVETLVDRIQPGGLHSVTWTPNGLASGVYFYRLRTPWSTQTRKMVLVK